jgi:hypothetical protein
MNSITANNGHIEIPISKGKVVLLLAMALCFVALGIWFAASPATFTEDSAHNPPDIEISIIGYVSIILFGGFAALMVSKLLSSKLGFKLDETGFTDNTGPTSGGFVKWDDVAAISVRQVKQQKIIMVHLHNPDQYIQNQTSFFKKKMMAVNQKSYNAPIGISAISLQCTFAELHSLLTESWNKYKKNQSVS